MTSSPASRRRNARPQAAALLGLMALAGCGTVSSVVGGSAPEAGQPGHVRGFLGGVVADEPRAALVARDVLSAGGTAVDAAVAGGFAMAVTLPSRAGLGGGGACLVYDPARNATESVVFMPQAPGTVGGDRPAALPMMARGLFALHTRKPRRPFEELMAPAEQLARFGTETSRALATDLAAVAGPLLADAGAASVFAPQARPLAAGEQLAQPDLSATLAALRTAGVGDLYQGAMARRLEQASRLAGGPLTVETLRPAVAQVMPPLQMTVVSDTLSFLPPPADGGLAAAVASRALQAGQSPEAAAQQGLAAAATWRRTGGDGAALLANPPAGGGAGFGPLPASSSLVVLDNEGGAVSCAFTMNNLFGTGRMVPGMGFLMAAAPVGRIEPPLLSAVMVHSRNLAAFRYAGASSGQEGAPLATALPVTRSLVNRTPIAQNIAAVPEPGRANAVDCARYLPGDASQCVAVTDPRGAGLAVGGLQ